MDMGRSGGFLGVKIDHTVVEVLLVGGLICFRLTIAVGDRVVDM